MEVKVTNQTICFSGVLDEAVTVQFLEAQLIPLISKLDAPFRVDFSSVQRSNSVGLLAWFRFVQSFQSTVLYVNTPVWMVEQFNFTDLLNPKNTIHSFHAPFYCQESDQYETKILTVGKDIELTEDYSSISLEYSNPVGQVFEPDFEPSEYFHFLSRLWKQAVSKRTVA